MKKLALDTYYWSDSLAKTVGVVFNNWSDSEPIKIITDTNYRVKLGKMARKSMKQYDNELTLKKWVELLLAVYNGDYYYNKLRNERKKLPEKEAINLLEGQIMNMKK